MPLIQGKSNKAFQKNVETEMSSGKPQDQSLAIAYNVKRKNRKKMAKGGSVRNESAATEQRPMPQERDKDAAMVSRNSGKKSPKEDSWTDDPTVKQAQKPSITKLSQPKIVGSDAFSVRNRDQRDENNNQMDAFPPETDRAQPQQRYNEIGADRQGPKVPDMERQHNNKRAAYEMAVEHEYAQDVANANMKKVQSLAMGGPVMEPEDDTIEMRERRDEANMQSQLNPSMDEGAADARSRNEMSPNRQGPRVSDMERQHNNDRMPYAEGGMIDDEEQMEHEDSIAAAIMARKDRRQMHMDSDSDEDQMSMMASGGSVESGSPDMNYAEGGEIHSHDSIYSDDSSQVDLSRNADEDANEEDQTSFNALRKENYSESEGLELMDSPLDSNQHGDQREDDESDPHDRVSRIMSKMNMRRQFKQR